MGKRTIKSLLSELYEHMDCMRAEIRGRDQHPGCEDCVTILRLLADRLEADRGTRV